MLLLVICSCVGLGVVCCTDLFWMGGLGLLFLLFGVWVFWVVYCGWLLRFVVWFCLVEFGLFGVCLGLFGCWVGCCFCGFVLGLVLGCEFSVVCLCCVVV